jgi:hypothetical protein
MSRQQDLSIPHRLPRGSTRSALPSGTLAGGVKHATVSDHSRTKWNRNLVLTHRKGLRLATFNVRMLNECGAASLLVKELRGLEIALASLQEVRWPGSGEMMVEDYKVL